MWWFLPLMLKHMTLRSIIKIKANENQRENSAMDGFMYWVQGETVMSLAIKYLNLATRQYHFPNDPPLIPHNPLGKLRWEGCLFDSSHIPSHPIRPNSDTPPTTTGDVTLVPTPLPLPPSRYSSSPKWDRGLHAHLQVLSTAFSVPDVRRLGNLFTEHLCSVIQGLLDFPVANSHSDSLSNLSVLGLLYCQSEATLKLEEE